MGRRHQDYSPERSDSRSRSYHTSSRTARSSGLRGRKLERSSSRSPSHSSSHSRSSSESPRRTHSRSRSNDSRRTKKHKKNRTSPDSKRDRRRSTDRNRDSEERSASKRVRDRSFERNEENPQKRVDKRLSSDKSDRSPEKPSRSAIPSSKPHDDTHSDNDVSDDKYGQRNQAVDAKPSKKFKSDEIEAVSDGKLQKESRKISMEPIQTEKGDHRASKEHKEPETIKEDPERFYSQEMRYEASPTVGNPARYPVDDSYARDQDYRQTGRRRSRSPVMRNPPSPSRVMRERDLGHMDDDFPESKLHLTDRESFHRAARSDPRYIDDSRRIADTAVQGQRGRHLVQGIRSPPAQEAVTLSMRSRSKRSYEGDERGMMRDFEDPRAPLRREGLTDDFDKRRYIDESLPLRDVRRDYYDDRIRMEVGAMDRMVSDRVLPVLDRAPIDRLPGSRMLHVMDRERSPMFDDKGSTGSGPSHHGSIPRSFNGTVTRDIDKSVLGLSQEKMALVRERKEEVEKSFRQDCETFAAVTKMLISKDSTLEDKLQACLKENLKDVGQRCIHELREYIDELKGLDTTQ